MCGICCCVATARELPESVARLCETFLARRGPDAAGRHCVALGNGLFLHLCGCVLHLRGPLVPQPVVAATGKGQGRGKKADDGGETEPVDGARHGARAATAPHSDASVLLWNGELYDGLGPLDASDSDTACVFAALTLAARSEQASAVCEVVARVRGPWAMVFWDAAHRRLWYGRDVFGRRSLLVDRRGGGGGGDDDGVLWCLSSVGPAEPGWEEVPADGLRFLDLSGLGGEEAGGSGSTPRRIPRGTAIGWGSPELLQPLCALNQTLPSEKDLGRLASEEGRGGRETDDAAVPEARQALARGFLSALESAVSRRSRWLRVDAAGEPRSPGVAVLFSGGIDCVMVAAALHRLLPPDVPVDLLNVAFANQRWNRPEGCGQYSVPDRVTGLQGWQELQALPGARTWRFVEVDVPRAELDKHRPRVQQLIRPQRSVMDDNIGCAIWFAARGVGNLVSCPPAGAEAAAAGTQSTDAWPRTPFTSSAKVLFLGMGADEQLGGYGRHRVGFQKAGWQGLLDEVALDVGRISTRNLGRDDRCISDHGKEARFPYLDDELVGFLNALRIDHKADMRRPRGAGEKQILRDAARLLGLPKTAGLPKRAIQFGSKIAKMDSGRTSGTDDLSQLP